MSSSALADGGALISPRVAHCPHPARTRLVALHLLPAHLGAGWPPVIDKRAGRALLVNQLASKRLSANNIADEKSISCVRPSNSLSSLCIPTCCALASRAPLNGRPACCSASAALRSPLVACCSLPAGRQWRLPKVKRQI